MISGYELMLSDALLIAALGLVIVIVELGLISLLVRGLSGAVRALSRDAGKPAPGTVKTQTQPEAVSAERIENADAPAVQTAERPDEAAEIAAAMTAVLEEMGAGPEDVVFLSCSRQ